MLEGREAFKVRYNILVGVTKVHKKANRGCSYPYDSLYRRGIKDPYG